MLTGSAQGDPRGVDRPQLRNEDAIWFWVEAVRGINGRCRRRPVREADRLGKAGKLHLAAERS
jgi:hypothetical protein